MKLPLGIILTLLLILQTFQQVSTEIHDEWKRDDGAMNNNETQSSSEKPTVQTSDPMVESIESSSEVEGEEPKQNSTEQNEIPDHSYNDTLVASSGGPISTTPPHMIALNSSSDLSETSAESNETQSQETTANTPTPHPEHTDQSALNGTYTSPKPETTTIESNLDETGSGNLPSDDEISNSTTKSPATTTDESVQYKTTVSPTEPVNGTTTPVIPPAIPEDFTAPVPDSEDTGANLTGPFDNKDNSDRGLSSADITVATENKKGQAWAIVLAVGIIVGIIALAAFIILNRRNRRDFSHRKLVEETLPDPVLRLDNSEPLDLKFGRGYYNQGLQGDNIQMTNFPQGRSQ